MAAFANINSTLFAMNTSLLICQMFSKIKDKLPKLLTFHPLCDGVTSVFLEGVAEGAIAVEPTLLGQCHSCDCTRRITVLKIQPHEVFDTQAVDIGIISNTLLGEMATEIGAVGADGHRQLLQGQVVLEIESCRLAMLFQQSANITDV